MKVKTSELTGVALDWAVAKCEGLLTPIHGETVPRVVFYSDQWQKYMRLNPPPQVYYSDRYEPSTDPAQAWPIIDREGIGFYKGNSTKWWAHPCGGEYNFEGTTSLIAAMRCYVASKLGEEIEVPDELLK